MGRKRGAITWTALVIALLVLAVFFWSFQTYRFCHPELTETQLVLWALARWYFWVPATIVGATSVVLLRNGAGGPIKDA